MGSLIPQDAPVDDGALASNNSTIVDDTSHRQQGLYYSDLVSLKVACEYMRLYRQSLSARMTWFAWLRGITSSGAVAAWAVVQSHPLVWGGIIAITQVADAIKDEFPLVSRLNAASAALMSLDALFIDAEFEWDRVFSGLYSNTDIMDRRRKLKQIRLEIDAKHFPTRNLPKRSDLLKLAEADVEAYFRRQAERMNK